MITSWKKSFLWDKTSTYDAQISPGAALLTCRLGYLCLIMYKLCFSCCYVCFFPSLAFVMQRSVSLLIILSSKH